MILEKPRKKCIRSIVIHYCLTCQANAAIILKPVSQFTLQINQSNSIKRQPHKMVNHTQTILWLLPPNCLSVFDHFVGLAIKGFRVNVST